MSASIHASLHQLGGTQLAGTCIMSDICSGVAATSSILLDALACSNLCILGYQRQQGMKAGL